MSSEVLATGSYQANIKSNLSQSGRQMILTETHIFHKYFFRALSESHDEPRWGQHFLGRGGKGRG